MYKILIADDEEIEISAFKLMIGNNFDDVSVLTAGNGVEAMLTVRVEKPDIVFMDIEMPGVDGLAAIEELKRDVPDTRFIVHTAYSSFAYAQKAVKVGADDYLLKPVKMQVLIDIIGNHIADIEKKRFQALESMQLASKLAKFKPFIEKDIVVSVVNGVEGQGILMEYASMFDFQVTRAFCIIFKINGASNAELTPEKAVKHKNEIALAMIETLKQICQCVASEYISGSVLAIIPFEKHSNEYDLRLWSVQLAHYICSKLRGMAVMKVGIGGLTSLECIHTSYVEAYKTLNDSTLDLSVKHHDDLIPNAARLEDVWRLEAEIGELIITRKNGEALQRAGDLFNHLVRRDQSMDRLKGMLVESCSVIKRFIETNIIESFSTDFGVGLLASLTSYDALKHWLEDFIKKAADQTDALSGKRNSTIIHKARIYIEKNFNQEITLENVAASVCVTPYYLSRLFKKETGENFNAYLTQFRIEKAKELFRSTNQSIKTVSYDTGFNTQAYFCRVFKKMEGISPSEYIQNLQK